MEKKQLRNLSANALQLIFNQLFGFGIFYILSTTLSKDSFGNVNLALAILLAIFNILSCGIDQLIIKKIAAGEDKHAMLSLYISHTLITGLLLYGLLLAGAALFPHRPPVYNLVLLIGIGKLMVYFSTPFKQVANGLERFKLLARLLLISNFTRCVCLIVFAIFYTVNLTTIIAIFIAGDTLELLIGIYLFRRAVKMPLAIKWNKTAYFKLLRESLPQTGVVIITSSLARFDWIFIGIMVSAVKLAEYSFAYKIFEIATLPLLAIAPLLIPHFTKLFQQQTIDTGNFKLLVRLEMMVAALIGLILTMCWSPFIDWLTVGKYGAVNASTIFILSLCMPFLYLNNFLWTVYFAQGKLKMILHAFVITLIVNVAGDIMLIPLYKNEGAAFGFLLSCMAQALFFLRKNTIPEFNNIWQPLFICTGCALISGFLTDTLALNAFISLPVSIVFYLVLLAITRQIKLNGRESFAGLVSW